MAGPLAGFRIVDLTTMLTSPWATSRLGEHNDEIMVELGYSAREIESLRKSGVLGAEIQSAD